MSHSRKSLILCSAVDVMYKSGMFCGVHLFISMESCLTEQAWKSVEPCVHSSACATQVCYVAVYCMLCVVFMFKVYMAASWQI